MEEKMEEKNAEKLSYEELEKFTHQTQQNFTQVQGQIELYKKQLEKIVAENNYLREQLKVITQDMSFKAIDVTFKVLDEKYRHLFPEKFISFLIGNIISMLEPTEDKPKPNEPIPNKQ